MSARRYRLTGSGTFARLFRTGTRREGLWLQLVCAPAERDPGRVGYVIAGKTLPSAVARNRIRRALREVVRRARPQTARYDVILRLRRSCTPEEIAAVASEAADLLRSLARDSERDSW